MASTYDLIVVGGGIIGCGIAERLRGELSSVCVVEQAPILGAGASSAAIGGINPHLGDYCLDALGVMAEHSRQLFPDWIERIATTAGTAIPLLPTGLLQIAASEKELERLATEVMPVLVARELDARMVTAGEARAIEPMLGPNVRGGLTQPRDVAVEPSLIVDGLSRILCADRTLAIRLGAQVEAVTSDSGGAVVTLRGGMRLTADRVVVAAGHYSPDLIDLPAESLFPVKGQAVEFAAASSRELSVQCDALIMDDGEEHVVFALPRPDGRIVAGVTFERHQNDTTPTREARIEILRNLALVLPTVAAAPVDRAWAGVRPGTADGAPVIGYVDDHRRVLAVTGHYGMGITLAPVTVDLAVKLLLGRQLSADDQHDLRISDPGRFPAEPAGHTVTPNPKAH